MNLSPLPIQKFFDNNGAPLVNGQLFTYGAGGSVKVATYVDSTGSPSNTNPIRLDFRGECRLWIDPTLAYKFVLAPATDTDPPTNPIWTVDNITAGPVPMDNAAVDTGSVNAIQLAIPLIISPVAFTRIVFQSSHTNTGPVTISINGGTAKRLLWQNFGELDAGEIQTSGIYQAIYDGAQWQLQGPTLQAPQMRTAAEITAGVTPVAYVYPPGNVKRYGATGDGVSDDWQAIQNAIDSCSSFVYFPTGAYKIGQPLLIRSTSFPNLTFVGESRTNTYLMPLSIDIKHAPQNINTLIFNQSDNGKFSISNLRFQSDVAYTGISIYAVEGGGGDASGQAIFSGSIDNCWFGMSSQNTGVFRGALDNYRVTNNVFEFTKGCFYRQGGGMGDVIFENNQLFFCFDSFYDGMTDTTGDNLVSIVNLHAYVHSRGTLINTQNSESMTIINAKIEADLVPLAPVALFGFKNCTNIIASDFSALKIVPFGGSGPIGEAITVEASSVKLDNGIIDGADVGIRLTGNGSLDLSIQSVDIYNSTSAAFRVQTGSPGGRVSISDSSWVNGQGTLVLFSNSASLNFAMSDCRVLNAGLAAAGARNFIMNSSGIVRISDCEVGRNTGSALASFFFEANGVGVMTLVDMLVTGAPPTGFSTGSQTITLDGFTGTWTPSVGGTATYTLQQGAYSVKSKCVSFWGRLTINVIGTGSQTTINGLPFTNNATYYGCGVVAFFAASATAVTALNLTVSPGTSQVGLRTLVAAAAATGTANIMQNGTDLIFSGSYQLP